MGKTGWIKKSTRRQAALVLTAVAVVVGLTTTGPASGAPTQGSARETQGEGHAPKDKDNRDGVALPSARQVAAAKKFGSVRFNALGTPHTLGPSTALASGLSADPDTAARQFLTSNEDLFGLDAASVASMETLLVRPIGEASVVLLRQRFGDLSAGYDGLVSILVGGGAVLRVTSSLSRDTRSPEPATLSRDDAVAAALQDAGLSADEVGPADVLSVAVPTPVNGPRAAYAVTVSNTDAADPVAYTTYVDGITGDILVREDLVDFDSDNPQWAVFPATPPSVIASGTDPRVLWCLNPAPGCKSTVHDPNSGQAWDIDLLTGTPTFTSRGNSADNSVRWGAGTPITPATPSLDRDYIYTFTDQWRQAQCNPDVFLSTQRNDGDAAVTNLFAMHNRMHDFAWHLGFTEAAWNMQAVNITGAGLGGDAESGRAQSNALGGSRNNANQNAPRDGLQPQSNMFLWQPVAGGVYPPCVDGDYDMTVIGHEYTHAISNRMIAGPNNGIGSFQGGSMGEAWSDMVAAEVLAEHNLHALGASPFVTGAYVTGNMVTGIRNYDASKSPLNFSDIGYDVVGPEVHSDGEIWVAINLRVRELFVKRYGKGTPALQLSCAEGATPATACPGNRRWIQLVFDSFLLQAASQVSMIDMRDNMLAADVARFGGANQDIIWEGFAASGMGQGAVGGPNDTDVTPSFASPLANNATATLVPTGDATGAVIRLYVGDYEARSTPIADTDPATAIPDTFQIVPKTPFTFTAVGAGFGHQKFGKTFQPGNVANLQVNMPRNLTSTAAGAVVTGDGVNLARISDDTEGTDWASLTGPVAGKQVTFDLAGDAPALVSSVNVSTLLRPAIAGDPDPGGQNRFTALRSFEILACNAAVADCSLDASYTSAYVSPADAFPAAEFRPVSSQLNLRSFAIPPTLATHLRLRVLTSQCTGNPLYAGEQDLDPRAATDCATNSPFAAVVRIAEFQAFAS